MQVNFIFPFPVGQKPALFNLTNEEQTFILQQQQITNTGNTTSANNYILDCEQLTRLKKYCEESVNQYFAAIYAPSSDCGLYITQSWVNFSKPGEQHHKHNHSNSFVSGVFYVEANKQFDKIWFHRTSNDFVIPSNQPNPFNAMSAFFEVGKGELIMFSSTVQHSVMPVETESTRVSIAFNTFIRGTIGESINLNELKFQM